jgi:hypothetical protein
LARALADLVALCGELQVRDFDLYLHQQGLETGTPSGRALFGMLGVFSEFERTMIRDRVMAGPGSHPLQRQAPGATTDDALQDRSHPRCPGRGSWCKGDGAGGARL